MLGRSDKINITTITDNVTAANNHNLSYRPTNRLWQSNGPWGQRTYTYDSVGNRTSETATSGGVTTVSTLNYPTSSNRPTSMTLGGGTTARAYTYDAAGNTLTDTRSGSVYAYTYNKANRLKTASFDGNLRSGTYTYNGHEQLITRVITNLGTSNSTIHTVHDSSGNIIAELNGTGQTVREYLWLPEAEIAPSFTSRAGVDRPMAVVDGVNTATPLTYMVHSDHLHRPIAMTDAAKVQVWSATWLAWGAPHSIVGSAALDARFPGQWCANRHAISPTRKS